MGPTLTQAGATFLTAAELEEACDEHVAKICRLLNAWPGHSLRVDRFRR